HLRFVARHCLTIEDGLQETQERSIMLTSLPIEQSQPNQEFYGLEALNLFETYTRAQFEAAGGPLIPFDPTRPEQNWWDDTCAALAPAQSVRYNAVVFG